MELLLNICWLTISAMLIGFCLFSWRRGALRQPVWLALAGTLVIVLILFPVISMSDDLQMAAFDFDHLSSFDVEHPRRAHEMHAMLEPAAQPAIVILPLWILLMFALVAMRRIREVAGERLGQLRPAAQRKDAVRPPPSLIFACL